MSDLVKWTPNEGRLIPKQGCVAHCFDLTTNAGKRQLFLSFTGRDALLSELVNTEIAIVAVFVHWVRQQVDGEDGTGWRIRGVLLTDDGKRIATSSETALQAIEAAAAIWGLSAPFQPPLRMKVQGNKRSNGQAGMWISLDPLL